MRYAIVLAAIDGAVLVAYAASAFRRARKYATWAVRAQPKAAFRECRR